MIKCDCCEKEIKQVSTPYISKKGDTLCSHCTRFVIYTEQAPITKDNCFNNYLYSKGDTDVLYVYPPVDTSKDSSIFLGFSGTWWKIELFDGSILYSNNVWCTFDIRNTPTKLENQIVPNIKSISSHPDNRVEALKALGWYNNINQSLKGSFDIEPVNLD